MVKKVESYENILNALHLIKKSHKEWLKKSHVDNTTVSAERISEFNKKSEESVDYLERVTDVGLLFLPSEIIWEVRDLLDKLENIDTSKMNDIEYCLLEIKYIEDSLGKVRKMLETL